jgi:hypothetical protein
MHIHPIVAKALTVGAATTPATLRRRRPRR